MDPFPKQESAEACHICADKVSYWVFGSCNHPVCFICALRLRCLYESKACQFCKTELESVIVAKSHEKSFQQLSESLGNSLVKGGDIAGSDSGMLFEDEKIRDHCQQLLKHNCPIRRCKYVARSKEDLKNHIQRDHRKLLCDICYNHKKIFSLELELFDRDSLRRHTEKGDETFAGHPLCGFCSLNFYSKDELFEHCRHSHEECHICRQNGLRDEYYRNYDDLEVHFEKAHFLCKEKECLEKKFVVFRNEIDLKGHMAEAHLSHSKLSRAQRNAMRRIDLQPNYVSSGAIRGSGTSSSSSNRPTDFHNNSNNNNNSRTISRSNSSELNVRRTTEDPALNASESRRNSEARPNSFSSSSRSQSMASVNSSSRSSLSRRDMSIESLQQETRKLTVEETQADREAQLVKVIREALGGNESRFSEFRNFSLKYRRNEINSNRYIQVLFSMFGMEKASQVFPVLLDSFPERNRRSQLLEEYNRQESSLRDFPALEAPKEPPKPEAVKSARVLVIKKNEENFPSLPTFKSKKKKKSGAVASTSSSAPNFHNVVAGPAIAIRKINETIENAYPFELPQSVKSSTTSKSNDSEMESTSFFGNVMLSESYNVSGASSDASSAINNNGGLKLANGKRKQKDVFNSENSSASSSQFFSIGGASSSNARNTDSPIEVAAAATLSSSTTSSVPAPTPIQYVAPIWSAKSSNRKGKSTNIEEEFPALPTIASGSSEIKQKDDFESMLNDAGSSSKKNGKKKILLKFG